jgi:hypothetical protein
LSHGAVSHPLTHWAAEGTSLRIRFSGIIIGLAGLVIRTIIRFRLVLWQGGNMTQGHIRFGRIRRRRSAQVLDRVLLFVQDAFRIINRKGLERDAGFRCPCIRWPHGIVSMARFGFDSMVENRPAPL